MEKIFGLLSAATTKTCAAQPQNLYPNTGKPVDSGGRFADTNDGMTTFTPNTTRLEGRAPAFAPSCQTRGAGASPQGVFCEGEWGVPTSLAADSSGDWAFLSPFLTAAGCSSPSPTDAEAKDSRQRDTNRRYQVQVLAASPESPRPALPISAGRERGMVSGENPERPGKSAHETLREALAGEQLADAFGLLSQGRDVGVLPTARPESLPSSSPRKTMTKSSPNTTIWPGLSRSQLAALLTAPAEVREAVAALLGGDK